MTMLPNRSENCPPHQGPDWDFGSSAMLRTLPSGHRLLVAGQKSGTVFAFDPDRNGALVWSTNVLLPAQKPPNSFGEIVYGGALDERNVVFRASQRPRDRARAGNRQARLVGAVGCGAAPLRCLRQSPEFPARYSSAIGTENCKRYRPRMDESFGNSIPPRISKPSTA